MQKKEWTILLCSLFSFFTLIIIFLIINIQNLIKTKKKLKESELNLHNNFNFLRTLLDTITTPMFCKDINGKYTDCNYAFEEYLGLSKDDIINNYS